MKRYKVALAIPAFIIAAVSAVMFRPNAASPEPSSKQSPLSEASPMMPLPPGPTMRGLMFHGMPMTPRLVATAAAKAGPYVVCVSSVRGRQDARSAMRPRIPADFREDLGDFSLTLQITGPKAAPSLVRLDTASLRVHDDMGGVRSVDSSIAGSDRPVSFSGGLGYILPFRAPAPRASLLRRIEGDLIVSSGLRHPFHIANLPLPLSRVSRVFGRMVPRRFATSASANLGEGLQVLQNEEANTALRKWTVAEPENSRLPQKLIFGSGVPASIGIPSPDSPERLTLKVSAGQIGRIDVTAQAGEDTWSGRLWDGDTLLIALPRRGGSVRPAAAIRLTLDPVPALEPAHSDPTFLPEGGAPGGSIVTRVLVNDHPFGRGESRIEIQQWRSSGWSVPRITSASIGPDGSVTLSNIAPGEYTIRRPGYDVAPDVSAVNGPVSLATYLEARFGQSAGHWEGELVPRFAVRTGQRTELPPLRFIPNPSRGMTVVKSR